MLRYCANLKATRYESTNLNRIVADKSHCVIVTSESFCNGKWVISPLPVDSGVKNRPIRFKLTARTDDLKILRTTLQIHWSSPTVNKRKVLTFNEDRDIVDGTLWSSCSRGYKFECSG